MKNNRLRLLTLVIVLVLSLFFINTEQSYAIYRQNLSTQISLTIIDPQAAIEVTLHMNDGTNNTATEYRTYDQLLGNVTPTARTNYNFLGWYDSNGNRVYANDPITEAIDLYAHWQKIVCKKVTDPTELHTETCAGTQGCTTDGIFDTTNNSTITYGTTVTTSSPAAGNAYNCDVDDDGNYDPVDQHGKHTERFYFLRETENNNSENTGSLLYYTSYDANGRVDTQNTPKDNIGSKVYATAEGYLPTSSTWTNPYLVDFDSNNGKVTRFVTLDEISAVCGAFPNGIPTSATGTVASASYFEACGKWFFFENSRFQSVDLGRAGIWVEMYNGGYFRFQTSTVILAKVASSSENMARPVIEIPMSAFEGYVSAERYRISFDTHGGDSMATVYRYSGETVGTIGTPTKAHNAFAGWYLESTYDTPVTSSTPVTGNMTLHAKWTPVSTNTVTFDANGGTIEGESTLEVIVDSGGTVDDLPTPTWGVRVFEGWYYSGFTTEFTTSDTVNSDVTVFAKWQTTTNAAIVNGVEYATLAAAIDAVPEGTQEKTRVTLLNNITLTEAVTIPSTKWVELDGGNHTISGELSLITNSGKLDIISGTITTPNMTTTNTLITNASGATLNISGGNLINPSANGTTEFLLIANNGGTVNITGGSFNSYGQSAGINNNSGTLNISGGEFIAHNATKGQTVYVAGGTVNISGDAYFENVSGTGESRGAVDNNGGTLNIRGGTIVSTGYSAVTARKNGSTTRIGTDDGAVDITTPVLRGKTYGLQRTNGTVYVYDGIFESLNNTTAVSGTVTTPTGINFTDSTVDVDGVTYHSTYLLAPTVTVRFYPENGESTITRTIDNGTTIGSQMPADPTKTDYYFDGWYDDGTLITSTTVAVSTIDAHARWVQSVTNATISSTLNVQIDSSEDIEIPETDIESVTYTSSNTDVATVDPSGRVTGVGVGNATITITGAKSGDTRTVTVTVTQIMRTVTFKDSDNTTVIYTEQIANNTSFGANMPANPPKTNYIFDAWYINGDSTLEFTSATTVTGDLVVVASWTPNIQLATIPSTLLVPLGDTNNITVTGPTGMESYTFTSADDNIATVNANGVVTGVANGTVNITVRGTRSNIARVVEATVSDNIAIMRTVTFKNDDGTTIEEVQVENNHSLGSSLMHADLVEANYIFKGWYVDTGSELTPFTSATVVTGDVIAVASWREELNHATVTTSPSPLSIKLGNTGQINITGTGTRLVEDVTYSSSDTNIATVSNGVVSGVDLGSVTVTITGSDSNQTETVPVTIHNNHSITFDADNGNDPSTIQVANGTSIDANAPSNPTKTGYVFDNWYLYENGNLTTTPIDTTEEITGDRAYKARWAATTDYAAIGTTYYATLALAIGAVDTNGQAEIRVLQDITNPVGRTTVDSNKDITINANGHTVSCGGSTANNLLYVNGGTLRVKNGTFTCNKSGLATLETSKNSSTIYVESGAIVTNINNRGAIYNGGTVYISEGAILESSASIRSTILNDGSSTLVVMYGGTVTQTATSISDKGAGAIKVAGGTVRIYGGTVTSYSTNSAAIDKTGGGTLVIGTDDNDNSYDATNPVIQGAQYGVNATSNYSVYDGIIKGKTDAVNNASYITETETGATKQTGTDGDYHTLYYAAAQVKYRINFNAGDGTVSPDHLDFDLNEAITPSDLPTPTNGLYNFDGWYDSTLTTVFTTFTPTTADTITLYAKWSYASSLTPVTHNVLSDAMASYFNNISSYEAADSAIAVNQDSSLSNDDHSTFTSNMNTIFTNNNCSSCNATNSCNSPLAGTRCDYPKGFDTGLPDDLVVYSYDNGVKGSTPITYVTSDDGVIYNMIPGKTYYWESASDNTKYGVITATGSRRTLKTDVRNLRDLGGLSVSYTDISTGNTVTGTIDYGRLYRGSQITSSQGVTDLNKLGVTREIDLRGNGDGTQTYKMSNYDIGTSQSYTDIVVTNYHINPVATTYLPTEANNTDQCGKTHLDEYRKLKAAVKQIMTYVVGNGVDSGDNIFFHCTIGTDRTGTVAYFLEGLLGVSEEDRLRDYELTYFSGLTNRTRFHDSLANSSINPRFYSMYKSYPTNANIYDWYTYERAADDDTLLTAFRQAVIH